MTTAPIHEKLTFKEKLGYGLGDSASNFFFQVFNLFLLYYYTDVFGLSPAVVGTMFLVTKIIDAVSDPVMGLIADRTSSRWGSFRPYILWVALPYGLCGYLMFASPELSDSGKVVYAYVTYTLMMLAYTAINVPYSSLLGVISPSSAERTKVSSYRFVCAFLAGWIVVTFVGPFKTLLGGGDEVLGFRLTMAIFAVISVLLFWFTFATTKERVHPPIDRSTDIKKDLSAIWSNGPWRALFISAIAVLMTLAVRFGVLLYYFKYYVGSDDTPIFLIFDKSDLFLSLGMLSMIVGVMLTKSLSDRFEKRTLMVVLTTLNAVATAAFFFIPPDQYLLMVVVYCVGNLLNGPTPALVWSMYADCADYGEWKTGRRTTGLVFSTVLFAQKTGLAVGAGCAGIMLGLFGFVANEVQSDSAILGIRLMFSIIPAILSIIGAVAILFYKIDRNMLQQMETDLAIVHLKRDTAQG
ncbi:MAG: GPH family glycoside/pentoside/hexuronide:cation symporter [Cryomorphaceae bacterium]|jgi:GPH family glycoside/pentoside/hexuronide:cation symporter